MRSTAPEKRAAQIRLARELTKMVHGSAALDGAERAARALFSEEIGSLSESELLDVLQETPRSTLAKEKLTAPGLSIVDICVAGALAASKGEARRLISGGGVYLNNDKIDAGEKDKIEAAAKELEEALKGEDKNAIEARTAALMTASQKLGEKMYADQQAKEAAQAAAAGESADTQTAASKPSDDDNVVDAEVKEVKKG